MSTSILDFLDDKQKAAVSQVQRFLGELNQALSAAATSGVRIEIDSARDEMRLKVGGGVVVRSDDRRRNGS